MAQSLMKRFCSLMDQPIWAYHASKHTSRALNTWLRNLIKCAIYVKKAKEKKFRNMTDTKDSHSYYDCVGAC